MVWITQLLCLFSLCLLFHTAFSSYHDLFRWVSLRYRIFFLYICVKSETGSKVNFHQVKAETIKYLVLSINEQSILYHTKCRWYNVMKHLVPQNPIETDLFVLLYFISMNSGLECHVILLILMLTSYSYYCFSRMYN